MTIGSMPRYLPGEQAPVTSAYHELDPWTWKVVRRLLVPEGDPFPEVKKEGGFYTASTIDIEAWRAARSSRPA